MEAALLAFECHIEFNAFVKEHKDEIAPLVNKRMHSETYPHPNILSVALYKGLDALDCIMDTFWNILNPNGSSCSPRTGWTNVSYKLFCRSDPNVRCAQQLFRLTGHPKYDIRELMQALEFSKYISVSKTIILEKIIAIAIPPNKYAEYEKFWNPMLLAYAQDPSVMRKKMRLKHFPREDACQIFCLILLIENKILCCA